MVLLTQETQAKRMSFIPLVLPLVWNKVKRAGENEKRAWGGVDRATANTKNGCGNAPLLSPLCRKCTYNSFLLM